MRTALTAYDEPSFALSDDGLIEVRLGLMPAKEKVLKSVLFCPFCGSKVPYNSRMH